MENINNYLLAEPIGVNPKTNRMIFKDFYVCRARDIVEVIKKYDEHYRNYHKYSFSGFCLYDNLPMECTEGEWKLTKRDEVGVKVQDTGEVEIEDIDLFVNYIHSQVRRLNFNLRYVLD